MGTVIGMGKEDFEDKSRAPDKSELTYAGK
jgi:hypothetical protein